MSSGRAGRFSGASAVTYSRIVSHPAIQGVSVRPGATALTRISGPSTRASSRVRWFSAALETA